MTEVELEKIKIDILRDAVKDVVDTIRALDKKIRYIISFNALALGFVGSILLLYKKELQVDMFSTSFIFGLMLLVPWIFNLVDLLSAFDPKVNPNNIFCSDNDKKLFKKCYFVPFQINLFGMKPKELVNLNDLVKNYDNSIKNIRDVKLMLYKEISKLSYIRDVKIKQIKINLKATIVFTLLSFFLLFYFAFLGNIAKNESMDNNNSKIVASIEIKNTVY